MVPLRVRILGWTDRVIAVLLGMLLLGSGLAFGGLVWWWRPVGAGLATALGGLSLFRAALAGRLRLWKSPLPILGMMMIGLGLVQLLPWPGSLGGKISPEARGLHARGVLPARVAADDPGAELPEALGSRSPLTVDRSATLRWVFDSALLLMTFLVAGRFADRIGRLAVVWGCIVAVFAINAGFFFVELVGQSTGLFGFITPGHAPGFAPSALQLLQAPGLTELRPVLEGRNGMTAWLVRQPGDFVAFGTMVGGAGTLLAIGALGLPLTLSLLLHVLAPRGSRDRLVARLAGTFRIGLVGSLAVSLLLGAGVIGCLAGFWLSLPFAAALALIGLPAMRGTGLRWLSAGVTAAALVALLAGVGIRGQLDRAGAVGPWQGESDWAAAQTVWRDSARAFRDFPMLGSGLGTFATIYPSYKSLEAASTTARSSVLQFAVEAGAGGLAVAGLGLVWIVLRVVPAWRMVGTADRALAWGLIGTGACAFVFLSVHWMVEVPAVALAAAAFAGTLDRWLAGGTDMFVDACA